MEPRDYIDPDEGRELVRPAAFFTQGEPCENCGRPCEKETCPACNPKLAEMPGRKQPAPAPAEFEEAA